MKRFSESTSPRGRPDSSPTGNLDRSVGSRDDITPSDDATRGNPGSDPLKAAAVTYRRPAPDVHPPYRHEAYRSTVHRAPRERLVIIPQTLSEITGPAFGHESVRPGDEDLTRQHSGEPLGERIIVSGQVRDEDGTPVRNSLVEVWQANSAGRYTHQGDQHPAPLDPNFSGAGRTLTDDDGIYRFVTVKPGAYPWKNSPNAWRPAHIHFSLFGPAFVTRLVTQMYFPGDPLLELDPIYQSIPGARAKRRLISILDMETAVPEWALAYRFDIVVRGRDSTPFEDS